MRPGLAKRAAYGESSAEAGTEDGLRASEPNHEARRDYPLQQQGIYGSSSVPIESLSVTVGRSRVVTRYYYPSLNRETDFFIDRKGIWMDGCPAVCGERHTPRPMKRRIHDGYKNDLHSWQRLERPDRLHFCPCISVCDLRASVARTIHGLRLCPRAEPDTGMHGEGGRTARARV